MAPLTKSEYQTQASFRHAIRRFLRYSEDTAREAGITPQQYQLLLVIKGTDKQDWMTITEIADLLQIRHHSAVELCQRAQQIDLISMSRNSVDRRQVCVTLTDKGEEILDQVASKNRAKLEALKDDIIQMFVGKVSPYLLVLSATNYLIAW